MAYGELYLPPIITHPGHNAKNGRFLKGRTPDNKGKKWDEYMSKRAQRRAMKGWKNFDKHRPKTRPDNAGRCRKKVIAVWWDGSWKMFDYIGAAAEMCGCGRENIGRCCRQNMNARPNKYTGIVNTDHKYNGIRFYFNEDINWLNKIR